MKTDLISKAVEQRLAELCNYRVVHLNPQKFGEMASFVSSVRQQLVNTSPGTLKSLFLSLTIPAGWIDSSQDCLESLRMLSLEEQLPSHLGTHTPVATFLRDLKATSKEPQLGFQLLTARYACPLNFALPEENEIREYVLMRLMVQDRKQVETGPIRKAESDNVLLKLNLVAIHAAAGRDLRFLDALNYYYEILPPTWRPDSRHAWLLVSYLGLYARALVAWL